MAGEITKVIKSAITTTATAITSTIDPRVQHLKSLMAQCFTDNATHSVTEAGEINNNASYCPRFFDGFSCWDETPAGLVASQNCPSFVVGFDHNLLAFKRCNWNGTWETHPDSDKPWTNYTSCVDVEDLGFRNIVNYIYVYGYLVSAFALILSISIFAYYRALHCTRIRIHTHLFLSFLMNNLLWIFWYLGVVNNPDVLQENATWCQTLHVATNYSMLASYFWMFCESLHLHIALVVVFIKEEVAMCWFLTLGWGISGVFTFAYAITRVYRYETARCWMDDSDSFQIITIPVAFSLVVSLVFLINVLRVLLTKIRPTSNQQSTIAFKKATRAALILVLTTIPLFGLHYILIPLRPAKGSDFEKVYQVVSALIISLQGLGVAVLFCFTNQEVKTATRNHVNRAIRPNEGLPMTGVTAGESIVQIREQAI